MCTRGRRGTSAAAGLLVGAGASLQARPGPWEAHQLPGLKKAARSWGDQALQVGVRPASGSCSQETAPARHWRLPPSAGHLSRRTGPRRGCARLKASPPGTPSTRLDSPSRHAALVRAALSPLMGVGHRAQTAGITHEPARARWFFRQAHTHLATAAPTHHNPLGLVGGRGQGAGGRGQAQDRLGLVPQPGMRRKRCSVGTSWVAVRSR